MYDGVSGKINMESVDWEKNIALANWSVHHLILDAINTKMQIKGQFVLSSSFEISIFSSPWKLGLMVLWALDQKSGRYSTTFHGLLDCWGGISQHP